MATAPQPAWVGHSSRKSAFKYDRPPISTQEMNCMQRDSFTNIINSSDGILKQTVACRKEVGTCSEVSEVVGYTRKSL